MKTFKTFLEAELDERNYAKEYANYQGRPDQIEKRSSRNKARRIMAKKTNVDGKDVGHADNNPLNNDPANLRMEDPSDNRREPRMRNEDKDPRLARAGVSGFNKPKGTPSHPKKSHIVVAKDGSNIKTIRFGEQGASTAGDPKSGESSKMKAKRKSFKARHGKNIAKGKMSAAYWADKVKW